MRLLHPRHGHGRQGSAGPEPGPHSGRDQVRPADQHLPVYRVREDHRGRAPDGEDPPGGPHPGGGRGAGLEAGQPGPPHRRGREGPGDRHLPRRRVHGGHALRLRRPLRPPPCAGEGHPHGEGQGPPRRSGGIYRRRHPRAEQGGPSGEGLGHHDRRGQYHPLPGGRRLPGGGGDAGDPGGGQEAGGGGL